MGKLEEMGYTRFVQAGRVALVNFGPDNGKLVVIVDVIDQNRCLAVGPTTDVPRQVIGYKRLSLTDIKIPLGRAARAGTVVKAWTAADVEGQWAACSWGKKVAARKAWTQGRRRNRPNASRLRAASAASSASLPPPPASRPRAAPTSR